MRTYISKILATLFIATASFGVSGCSDFLEETPYDFISLEQLDDSEDSMNYLLTGVYSKWCDNILRYNNFPYSIELDADYISGPSWLFGSLGAGNFQDADNVTALWSGLYSLIERSNLAAEQIEEMESIDDDVKANALGELYFQKAICYFILTRAFGEIPLNDISAQLATEIGAEIYNPRSSIKDVYTEIITLLKYAEQNLYNISDSGYTVGHVARGSAAGLLAKVYATMAAGASGDGTITIQSGEAYGESTSDLLSAHDVVINTSKVDGYEAFDSQDCYGKVVEYCAKLELGEYGSYALLDYEDLWQHSSYNLTSNAEYMFTLYGVNEDEIYGNKLNRYYSYSAYDDGTISKGLYVGNRTHWYELFEDGDKRIVDGVLHRWQSYGKDYGTYYPSSYSDIVASGVAPYDDGLTYNKASGSTNLAYVTKYFNVTDITADYTDANFSMLRYADVLLLYAEALNEITPGSSQAKELVQRVRERSLETASMEDWENAGTSRDAVRSIIIQERAKELACEA
ncbi:MAG: RagB/SusD family nutrient uptake outer membrane protein, partial [Rikenellaceae bacterium]